MGSVLHSTDIPIMNSFYEVFVHIWLAVILTLLRQPVVCTKFLPSQPLHLPFLLYLCIHMCTTSTPVCSCAWAHAHLCMYIHIFQHNWVVPFNISFLKPIRFLFFWRLSISMLIMGNQIYFYRILYSLKLFWSCVEYQNNSSIAWVHSV
jgi:hypothetical protein